MRSLGLAGPDLRVRFRQTELMDDPELDPRRHERALDALRRINGVSLVARRVWRQLRDLAARGRAPLRVLDVACGGGDVLHALGRRARACGLQVELSGCDLSERALEHARRRAPSGVDLTLFAHDAAAEPFGDRYDLVTSSLFLHHLDRSRAVRALGHMAGAARSRLLLEDLRRTRLGYAFAWVGLHTLTTSDVARADGLRSVRAAFTVEEATALCAEAGLRGVEVRCVWPQRFLLGWTP